jgi:hypothetical protein
MMIENKLKDLLKSRKFWGALVGLALVVAKGIDPKFPLDDATVSNLVYVIVAYILGTGLADARAK